MKPFLLMILSILLIASNNFSCLANAQNTAKKISNYEGRTCVVIDANDKLKCFGRGVDGLLGYGDHNTYGDEPNEMGDKLPYVDLGTGRTVKDVHVGGLMTCAILDTDEMKCWGDSWAGSLGLGITDIIGDDPGEMGDALPSIDFGVSSAIKPISFSTGGGQVCVLFSDNTMKCFGWNHKGQLGLGDNLPKGDNLNEMGVNLAFVDFGTEASPIDISCGNMHSCALFNNSQIKCWGYGASGQLGYGDPNNRGDKTNQMGDNLPFIDLGVGIIAIAISAGSGHTCVIVSGNLLKCFGTGYAGTRGSENQDNAGDGPNEMGNFLPLINLGSGATVNSVSAGSYKTCVILSDLSLKCFGINEGGDLGYENTNDIGDDPNEMGDNLPSVDFGTGLLASKVIASSGICLHLTNKKVKCWGDNTDGVLGTGDTTNHGSDPGSMGDNLLFVQILGTSAPTNSPTNNPTMSPTTKPTLAPSLNPTDRPSLSPTKSPSHTPSSNPTSNPTLRPTKSPTLNPTKSPTKPPQIVPTKSPTKVPSPLPSASPTAPCGYKSAKPCKYDSKCIWTGVGRNRYCAVLTCSTLSKSKCTKQGKRCKWNKAEKACLAP